MWHTIDLLYGQNLGCDKPSSISETVAHIFKVEQHLVAWERSLPDSLRLTCARHLQEEERQEPDYLKWRFRVILTLRYLNLRVLLHRPMLIKFIDARGNGEGDPHELRLLKQIGTNNIHICVQSAMDIIDLVYEAGYAPRWQASRSLLGAWWFSLYYTFNAALVVLGSLWICRDGDPGSSSTASLVDQAKVYPSRAVDALLNLDNGNKMVDRCRYYLENFNNALNPRDANMAASNSLVASLSNARQGGMSSSDDIDFSPLGMEFGEFLLDGELQGLTSRPGVTPADVPGRMAHQ
ncbi:hypothetical protein VTN77DRAFT_4204 [Rasamsonia byssochlamydoides]|uniref:uncharacterized protein n=1 Tax=Rasamsonia byssochlamydoides TaxID=89139 RepID=UPI003742D59D